MCDRYFSNLHPITTVRNEIQKLNEQNIFPPSLLFDQRLSYLKSLLNLQQLFMSKNHCYCSYKKELMKLKIMTLIFVTLLLKNYKIY